jgi:prevent-host-death family protein
LEIAMREVGILEAKTNLSALVEAVDRDGEEVMITRNGKPMAKLVSTRSPEPERPRRRKSGAELAEMFRELRERISRENPETDNLTWEEIKEDMRR